MNKHKWWHEYLLDAVAWITGLNLIYTCLELCFCKAYIVPLLVVELILSLVLLCVIHKVALEMDMVEK